MADKLTPEAVAQMVADREAGTPGPFAIDSCDCIYAGGGMIAIVCNTSNNDYGQYHGETSKEQYSANGRRFARIPDLEAAYLTLAAENATLRAERDKWVKIDVARDATFTALQQRYDTLRASEAAALERVTRLELALAFYADTETYETQYERMPCDCCTDIFEPINEDKGKIARQALTPAADKEPKT